MRRSYLAGALMALLVVVLMAPYAFAQAPPAPAPKVTISGFIDAVSSWSRNLSLQDLNYDRSGDREWYARTRARPDITAEIGTSKFVLGLEIDAIWGQQTGQDSSVCLSAACPNTPGRFGSSTGWDINTDTLGNIELKWAYAEFRLPIIPWASTVRLGAQPFAVTYKTSVLAGGDFAGANLRSVVTPALAFNLTYIQAEEASTGIRDGFTRGDDFGAIGSVEITPFKGLQLRPLYAYYYAEGITSGAARQGRGGVANSTAFFPLGGTQATERRHTVGLDARWSAGPFYFDPTVFFQFGKRESVPFGVGTAIDDARRRAWFVDLRGGWRAGPLLLEAAAIYTTGNKAEDDIRNGRTKLEYYEPIGTDTSYYGGWAEIWALGIDYFNILYATAPGLQPGTAIGYDKYGLIRGGLRASYDITPAFTIRAAGTANWSAEKVDTDSSLAAASGLTPGDFRGDRRYLGTEIDLGITYRFAPGIAFDLVGAYLFAGKGLGYATRTDAGFVSSSSSPNDVQAVASRVRFSF
jgi:hypothetical protein